MTTRYVDQEQQTVRKEVLDRARKRVLSTANQEYGDPVDNFETIALLWDVILKEAFERGEVEPHEVATAMIGVKLARLVHDPVNTDSWVDIAGYAACGAECADHFLAPGDDEPDLPGALRSLDDV